MVTFHFNCVLTIKLKNSVCDSGIFKFLAVKRSEIVLADIFDGELVLGHQDIRICRAKYETWMYVHIGDEVFNTVDRSFI